MKPKLWPTPAYQKAPDMRQVNQTLIAHSGRQMFGPFYQQALQAHPDLKTVGIHHQPTHNPSVARHLYGAIPSFSDGRHGIYVPLHGEALETPKEIGIRCPIAAEVSADWRGPDASDAQATMLIEALSFTSELGRASLQVAYNGRCAEYYEFVGQGVNLLPFRQSSLNKMADPQHIALVSGEQRYFIDSFGTSSWSDLQQLQYEGYRSLPREQYVENFVAYVAMQVDRTLNTTQREAWGLSNLGYTSDNGATQGTSKPTTVRS